MAFEKINLPKELIKERADSAERLLHRVQNLLLQEESEEQNIISRLASTPSQDQWLPDIDNEQIFSIHDIRNICLKYRLRFLDSRLFKAEIPYEAIRKVKELERKHKVKFAEFKILAPATLFKLEDRNKDPLLFAALGNGRYLLIHKWGNDMAWYRGVLAYPLRSARNFIFTVLALSLIISLAIPVNYTGHLFIFLICNLFFHSMFAHIGYMRLNQNFSEFEWNSRFIN